MIHTKKEKLSMLRAECRKKDAVFKYYNHGLYYIECKITGRELYGKASINYFYDAYYIDGTLNEMLQRDI